jgi:hypothetical protein
MSDSPGPSSYKISAVVNLFLRLALVVAALLGTFSQNWSLVFASIATLVLTYLPQFLANQVDVRLPLQFELAITVFLYATLFLGEVDNYYEKFWWWDSVLHTSSAFAFGFFGFLILYLLFARDKLKASPFVIAFFSFAFGLAIGALWEIFEFSMDLFFGTNMQKSGLRDTMGDLIVDALGSGVASITGYIYLKYKIYDPFDALIQWFLQENPRFAKNRRRTKN